jgi:large subunit ribosomal protein L3
MSISMVGRKCGMTRVFLENGDTVPVTVLHLLPNKVTQVKTIETDGYVAVQVTYDTKKKSKVSKSQLGHYEKATVEPGIGLHEFRIDVASELKVGDQITVSYFDDIKAVDVSGISKGKGFAGGVKRHHFAMQDATHGNSLSHRAPGSIGQNQTPGRVFKGKKMAGHMGAVKRTAPNLEVFKVDLERNLVLVKGSIPGAPGGEIVITPSIKGKN